MSYNSVHTTDAAGSQAYWGFPVTTAEEGTSSGADLSYSGAPDVASVAVDSNGKLIASPYMPNLLPPDSFSPIEDNQEPVVIDTSLTSPSAPFMGTGHQLSPDSSSTAIVANIRGVLSEDTEDTVMPPVPSPISNV